MSTGWVAATRIPQEFLERLAADGIGDGVEGPSVLREFDLPVMGKIPTELSVVIEGLHFDLRAADGGNRIRATVRARGEVDFPEIEGDVARPQLKVRGEVLVPPVFAIEDDEIEVGLQVGDAELQEMVIETMNVAEDSETSVREQMGQMVVSAIGDDVFGALRAEMEAVTLRFAGGAADLIRRFGLRNGPADVVVEDGAVVFGFAPADPAELGDLDGVEPPAADGDRVGISLASGLLGPAVMRATASVLDGLPVPFDLDLATKGPSLRGLVRNARLLPPDFVDLRPGLAWDVEPRLAGDEVEIGLAAAWLQLPDIVPGLLNRWNRRIGQVASLLPSTLRVPAVFELPSRPGGGRTSHLRIDHVAVHPGWIEVGVAHRR